MSKCARCVQGMWAANSSPCTKLISSLQCLSTDYPKWRRRASRTTERSSKGSDNRSTGRAPKERNFGALSSSQRDSTSRRSIEFRGDSRTVLSKGSAATATVLVLFLCAIDLIRYLDGLILFGGGKIFCVLNMCVKTPMLRSILSEIILDECVNNEESSFVGFIQLYADKNAITLEENAIVAYSVHILQKKVSPKFRRRIIENGYTVVALPRVSTS